jgi:hypothetical protein
MYPSSRHQSPGALHKRKRANIFAEPNTLTQRCESAWLPLLCSYICFMKQIVFPSFLFVIPKIVFSYMYIQPLYIGFWQFASGRSCDRPTRSRFSVVFLGPRANAEMVPKFHFSLHASHAALPMVTPKISSYCTPPDVELKFFGWNAFNAEWTRHRDILIGWPSVGAWLWHLTWLWTGPFYSWRIYGDLSLQVGKG